LPPKNFERLLLKAVDEELSSLGESAKHAIYFYLEKNFNVKKQEIPQKIDVFTDAIERIFGLGAKFLEVLILKRLYKEMGWTPISWEPDKELTFTECIEAAKQSFFKEKRKKKTEINV